MVTAAIASAPLKAAFAIWKINMEANQYIRLNIVFSYIRNNYTQTPSLINLLNNVVINKNINIAIIVSILLSIFISTSAIAAEIYKWVDEDGKTHYSAKKPSNKKSKSMYVPGSTKIKKQTSSNVEHDYGGCKTITCRMNKYVNDNPIIKRKKTYSRSYDPSASEKARDAAIVSKCKKNRDVFCDKGAKEIQRRDQEKADEQRRAAREHKLNPPIPRYRGNDIHIR